MTKMLFLISRLAIQARVWPLPREEGRGGDQKAGPRVCVWQELSPDRHQSGVCGVIHTRDA